MEDRHYDAKDTLRRLLKRCVQCPVQTPSCPTCQSGEQCIQQSGSCDSCPSRICVPISQAQGTAPTPTPTPSSGTNVGAIAGGVAGGVVVIAVVTFLVYWFCVRGRQKDYPEDEYQEEAEENKSQSGYDYPNRPTHRPQGSLHSIRSYASTAMTHASNVIQIAFIPGITARDGQDGSSASSIPPVPDMPHELRNQHLQAHQPNNTPYSERNIPGSPYDSDGGGSQDHYFTADDIRNSAYSGYSNMTRASSVGVQRQSMASSLARESFASTVYPDHPAQMVQRGKANVVSVRSTPGLTPTGAGYVPEVPQVDYVKYGHMVRGGGVKRVDSGNRDDSPKEIPESQQEAGESSTMAQSAAMAQQVQHAQRHSKRASHHRHTGSKGSNSKKAPESAALKKAIQDAARRASAQPTHGGLGSINRYDRGQERGNSPFSDENALKEESESPASYQDKEGETTDKMEFI